MKIQCEGKKSQAWNRWKINMLFNIFAAGLVVIPASGATNIITSVVATNFVQNNIYHSPQIPGYTSWTALWRTPKNELRLAFQQVTGPVDDWKKRTNVTAILGSKNEGATWEKLREVPARTSAPVDKEEIYAAPGTSSFCGHGFAALKDETLITGLWPSGTQKSGYVQRSKDGGIKWSKPIYLRDPEIYKTYPTQIRLLRDGRLVLVAGMVKQADAKTAKFLLKEFFESRDGGKKWSHIWTMPQEVGLCEESDFVELDNGDLLFIHRAEHYDGEKYLNSNRLQNIFHRKKDGWEIGPVTAPPIPHSGFPELLKTREGVILHVATEGVWWTADAGAHWQLLALAGERTYVNPVPSAAFPPYPSMVLGTPYYPRATQLADGTILIVGHNGSDNVYGSMDQAIVQQTYNLNVTNAK